MTHTLVMGRDMNTEGTDVGPEVVRLLQFALVHQSNTGTTLVVAAGFNSDFPAQPRSYAQMMAQWLWCHGAEGVEVLEAEHFSSWGELQAFKNFSVITNIVDLEVLGYSWHLKRVMVEARQMGGRTWSKQLRLVPLADQLRGFDFLIEPVKWLKLLLPRRWQLRAISFWKRYIFRRTSY